MASRTKLLTVPLLAVERLDLRLLIETQHQGMGRRRKIKANDIPDLIDEQRVARQRARDPVASNLPFQITAFLRR